MSHLRAPAPRADRREGGRHGRPVTRPVPARPEAHLRPRLLRLAVLPPLVVALSAGAAVVFTVRATGVRPGLTLWGVLAGAVSVTVAGIAIAAVAADRTARAVSDHIGALRRSTARGEAELRALVAALRRGDGAPQRKSRGKPPADADDFALLAAEMARAHDGAVHAVVQAAQLSSHAGSEQKLEVFVNLARRLQSLVHREISILDELENEIEDPDLLKGLFHVDHLATRVRRHAENLAVLGGAVSRRQWSNPVSMTEVLRSAIAEVEQYSRVKLVPPIDGELRGHAVADVIHLLAELVENATVFSAPQTQVLLRADLVTAGLAVEVEDRGLGLPLAEQRKMNALLADPDQVNVASLLADGRIGLFVVSQLARRHGINVRLQTNIYGGVQAVLVVPKALLGTAPGASAGTRGTAPAAVRSGTSAGDQGQSPEGNDGAGPDGAWNAPGDAAVSGSVPGESWAPPGERETPTAGPAGRPNGPPDAPTEPSTGRRRHAQRDSTGTTEATGATGAGGFEGAAGTAGSAGATGAAGAAGSAGVAGATRSTAGDGRAPAPLPVRGAHEERPNPAEAVPGIRSGERWAVERQMGPIPTARVGTVHGTMDRPRLPRRRAQEHIAPQLRGGPAPRPEPETPAGHDPGLMAAFQRGIGLAEAQQHMESTQTHTQRSHMEPPYMGPPHTGEAHMDGAHMDRAHVDAADPEGASVSGSHMMGAHMEGTFVEATHTDMPHMDVPHMEMSHMDVPPGDVSHMDAARHASAHTQAPHTHTLPWDPAHGEKVRRERGHRAAVHMEAAHTEATHVEAAHMEGAHMGAAHTDAASTDEPHAHALVSDPSVRPDGNTPTG
ncbi:ATP-binding protein [Streptomyces sp. NPDC004752]